MADPGQAAADAALKQAEQARNSARDRMMADIGEGATCANDADDASAKTILVRGCDPVMAERAGQMLPPLLGGVTIEAATQDDSVFELLASKKIRRRLLCARGLSVERRTQADPRRQR